MTEQVKKQTISELPKEEQDKIIAKMVELKIRGAATCQNWPVETANRKIAEVQAQQGQPQPPADASSNDASPADVPPANAAPAVEQTSIATEDKKEVANPAAKSVAKVTKKTYPKCHICRSDYINGKCTGCGYSLNV